MLRLVAYSPDTPPVEVATIDESQLGHLEVFDDADLVANIVIRPFTTEIEVAVADARWDWLARTRLPTSGAAT
jgi:hypothetical protein